MKTTSRSFKKLEAVLTSTRDPILLLEGSRDVPESIQMQMETLAAALMRRFPELVVRTGNAKGSDHAWARGVNSVAPDRLQLVLPVAGYQRSTWVDRNEILPLKSAGPKNLRAAKKLTRSHYSNGTQADPAAYDRMPDYKKDYLDRDALKVLGFRDRFTRGDKATAALFYLNPKKKNGGGTGHTMRLCAAEGVPFFLAEEWLKWL